MKDKYLIGYIATVFYDGAKTKYEYVGQGEWKFLSGENTIARYHQMLDMVGQ